MGRGLGHKPSLRPVRLLREQFSDGLDRQVAAVQAALAKTAADWPVQGVLCFTQADLPLLGTTRMRSHLLLYGKALAKRLNAGGPFSPGEIAAIAHTLAGALPAALVRRLANIRRVRQTPRSLIPSKPATAAFADTASAGANAGRTVRRRSRSFSSRRSERASDHRRSAGTGPSSAGPWTPAPRLIPRVPARSPRTVECVRLVSVVPTARISPDQDMGFGHLVLTHESFSMCSR